MARYEPKTTANDDDVTAFLESVTDPVRRRDALTLRALFERATGQPATMWGSAIVGFGQHHYEYESGHSGDTAAVGFSPRKAATTVYLLDGFEPYAAELERLGPHSLGKSCLYLKDVERVDQEVLAQMVRRSYLAHAD